MAAGGQPAIGNLVADAVEQRVGDLAGVGFGRALHRLDRHRLDRLPRERLPGELLTSARLPGRTLAGGLLPGGQLAAWRDCG